MGVFTFNNLMAAIQSHGLTESFLLPMILNMSITGSLTILFVLLVRLAVKRAPKIFSYALWAVVLFRLLCPVSITTDFSLLGLFDTPIMENTEHTTVMEYVPFDVVHTRDLEVHLPVTPVINEAVNDVLPQEHAALGADPLEGEMAIASFVWLLGVAAMAVYSVVSYYRLRQKLLTASPLRDNIYLADEITSPFVMGLVRPKIYLPSDMEEREQAYIIRHEQHHIRRGDHIIKALAFLALSIHWFNPLVWVAFIYSNKDMEMSCDEAVVKKMGDGILADYTASLLSLATGKHIFSDAEFDTDEFNELTIVYFSHRDIDRLYELGRQESARHGRISDSWRRKIQDISEFFATGPTYSIFGFSHHFSTRGVVFEAKLSPDCYEPILFGNTLIDMVLYCQRDLRRLEARMEKEKVIELEAERKEAA